MNHRFSALVAAVVLVFSDAGCDAGDVIDPFAPVATGSTPNAVTLTSCGNTRLAAVTASADARLNLLHVDIARSHSVVLPVGSNPWDVAILATDNGPRAVVSLFGNGGIALIDPCTDADVAVLQTITDDGAIALDPPVDDATGTPLTSMTPTTPQAVAFDDDLVYVAFSNIIAFAVGDDALRAGPGLLLTLRLVSDRLVVQRRDILPCENPAALAIAADGDVVVTCSGRYKNGGAGFERASDGAIVRIDAAHVEPISSVVLDASPASIVIADDGSIVVGDALDGTVARFSADLVEQARTTPADGIDTVFALSLIDDGRNNRVLVAAHFDGKMVVDPLGAPRTHTLHDGPPRGVIDVVDDAEHDDGDVFVLLTLSAQLQRVARSDLLAAP